MDDTAWLEARGFKRVGFWSKAALKLQRIVDLQRKLGVYAFVVDRRIFYIAAQSTSRLQSKLIPEGSRLFRRAHRGIGETVKADGIVDVWIYKHSGSEMTIERLEAEWITERSPRWNGSGIYPPQSK